MKRVFSILATVLASWLAFAPLVCVAMSLCPTEQKPIASKFDCCRKPNQPEKPDPTTCCFARHEIGVFKSPVVEFSAPQVMFVESPIQIDRQLFSIIPATSIIHPPRDSLHALAVMFLC